MGHEQGVPLPDLVDGESPKFEVTGNPSELMKLLEDGPVKPKAVEVTEPAAEPEWIHEPSGKGFETELDMLRYESGWKSNKMGELRAQVEMIDKLAARGEQPKAESPTLTQEQMEKNLLKLAFPNIPDEQLEDPAYKQIARGMENLIGAYDGIVGEKFNALQSKLDKFEARNTEQTALQASGLDMAQIKNTLEKHPHIGDIKDVNARLAVIVALNNGVGEQLKTNPLRNALQPNPADHVEGSSSTGQLNHSEADLDSAIAEKLNGNDRDFLRALGDATRAAGDMPWLHD